MIIYINNQSIGNDVWFDDLNISMYSGGVMEENFYYPFGLTLSEQAANATPQPIRFQSQQHENDFGINMYSFKYREHDPQIGRFWQVDPLAEDYVYNSTYAFSENKVTSHIELEGAEAIGMGWLVDAISGVLSDAGWNRAAGFVNTYGHSVIIDPAYSSYNAVKTASTGDVNATVKAFDPTGVTSIPDVIETVGNAANGDAYAQGQVLGMIPAIVGGFKAAKIGIAPEGGSKVRLEAPTEGNLGNPFKNSTLPEVEKAFQGHVKDGKLVEKYTNPQTGAKSYQNTKSGYSYNLDPGGVYGKKTEGPHVDVNYPNPKPKNVESKKKLEVKSN